MARATSVMYSRCASRSAELRNPASGDRQAGVSSHLPRAPVATRVRPRTGATCAGGWRAAGFRRPSWPRIVERAAGAGCSGGNA
eukprot:466995-Alexandrium_andersonii.AAC.1